jgi:hypothetical protein
MIVFIFYPRCAYVSRFLFAINGANYNQRKLCLRRVKFEIAKVAALTHCHSSVCHKESGSSFATHAHGRRERFKLLSGEDFIDPGYERTSGSFAELLYALRFAGAKYIKATRIVSVPAGLLNDAPRVHPSCMYSPHRRQHG